MFSGTGQQSLPDMLRSTTVYQNSANLSNDTL